MQGQIVRRDLGIGNSVVTPIGDPFVVNSFNQDFITPFAIQLWNSTVANVFYLDGNFRVLYGRLFSFAGSGTPMPLGPASFFNRTDSEAGLGVANFGSVQAKAWIDQPNYHSLMVQLFRQVNSVPQPLSSPFSVTSGIASFRPSLTFLTNNSLFVAWTEWNGDGNGYDTMGQIISIANSYLPSKFGGLFSINVPAVGNQYGPLVGALGPKRALATWIAGDFLGNSIHAQEFNVDMSVSLDSGGGGGFSFPWGAAVALIVIGSLLGCGALMVIWYCVSRSLGCDNGCDGSSSYSPERYSGSGSNSYRPGTSTSETSFSTSDNSGYRSEPGPSEPTILDIREAREREFQQQVAADYAQSRADDAHNKDISREIKALEREKDRCDTRASDDRGYYYGNHGSDKDAIDKKIRRLEKQFH